MKTKGLLIFPLLLVSLASCSLKDLFGGDDTFSSAKDVTFESIDALEFDEKEEMDFEAIYPKMLRGLTTFIEDYDQFERHYVGTVTQNQNIFFLQETDTYIIQDDYFKDESLMTGGTKTVQERMRYSNDEVAYKKNKMYAVHDSGYPKEYWIIDDVDKVDFDEFIRLTKVDIGERLHEEMTDLISDVWQLAMLYGNSKVEFGELDGSNMKALKVTLKNELKSSDEYEYEGETYYSHVTQDSYGLFTFKEVGNYIKLQTVFYGYEQYIDCVDGVPQQNKQLIEASSSCVFGKKADGFNGSNLIRSMPQSFALLRAEMNFYDVLEDEGGVPTDIVIDHTAYVDNYDIGEKTYLQLPDVPQNSLFNIYYEVTVYEIKNGVYEEKEVVTGIVSKFELPFCQELEEEVIEVSEENTLVCFKNPDGDLHDILYEFTFDKKDNYELKLFNPVVNI